MLSPHALAAGSILVLALGVAALKLHALDSRGAIGAVILGIFLLWLGGVYPFMAMLLFFLVGVAATKYRFEEKVRQGFSSKSEKMRGLGNVLGNGFAVVIFLVVELITSQDIFWAATFSAIATVNGDTLASELGKVFGKKPRLITNLKPVKPGTNGGISLQGELFAFIGAAMIVPFALPLTSHKLLMSIATVVGGFVGVNIDSIIGATLENRGITDNNTTNLTASILGGLVGALTFIALGG